MIAIIGGGFAGLYCALQLSKKEKVVVLDDRNYFGGRAVTYYGTFNEKNTKNNNNMKDDKQVQFEIGAGRFHDKHLLLLKLIHKYKLTKIPLENLDKANYYHVCKNQYDQKKSQLAYIDEQANQMLSEKIREIIQFGKSLNKQKLQSMTFAELIVECYRSEQKMIQLRNVFGYYAEFSIMNAYDAIRSFELDFLVKEFYVLKEGFSELANCMKREIEANGGILLNNVYVSDVLEIQGPGSTVEYECKFVNQRNQTTKYQTKYQTKDDRQKTMKKVQQLHKSSNLQTRKKNSFIENKKKMTNYGNKIRYKKKNKDRNKDTRHSIVANKVIFCVKPHQLKPFSLFSSLYRNVIEKSITSSSLIRVYAIYTPNKSNSGKDKDNGKVWFHDIPKITTNYYLRQIIPVNRNTGLIMISYVDNVDSNILRHQEKQKKLKQFIQENLRVLFPNKIIPHPVFLKLFDWKVGVHYWKAGSDSDTVSKQMLRPFPGKDIYVAGEGFSQNQAWIEGALETAQSVTKMVLSAGK